MNAQHLMLALSLVLATSAHAGNSTLDAAIGGGIGAAIGNEVGGREGAIVGGALGAAIATSGSNDKDLHHATPSAEINYEVKPTGRAKPGNHCPPGQAKKGRC